MKDEDIEGIADAINEFVHDSVEPLSQGLSEVVKRVDEIHARPIPENGRDGIDGKDGVDGQDGAKGDTGEKGVDGVGLDAPVYESGVYREGSIVQAHFGQVYKAVRDTSEGVDSEDWERVGTSGFRLTGTFDAEKEYVAGDLFIKGFGLFLHDGAEARLIAGRGPEGKKGERGAAGKDGKDGQDGKDGATFDALEIKGTNLVAVIRSEEGLQEHAVDLAPFLEATVEVTKSVSEAQTDEAMKALDNQFKSLWETFQQHLTDQQATPVRFFRGGYTPSVTYQAGDLVNFSQSLYVAKQASTGILPHGQLAKDVKSGDYWAMLTSGGGGGVGDGELPVLPTYALVTELGTGGTKFRSFSQVNGTDPIVGVGLQNGKNVKFNLTTDAIQVNPNQFRNAKGQFAATPEELENLKNQRDVNEFLYDAIQKVEAGDINLDGYATEEWVTEQIDAIPDVNLDGYATEEWVTGQIDGIDFPAGTIVSDTAPADPEEGATWYDTVRLELFVHAMGAWLPCSPLGARVEQGEILQAQILSRVEAGEVQQQTLVDTKLGKSEANEVANSFRIKGTGGTYISASGGELGLYHVKYPEAETHAATMQYVLDEIAKVPVAENGPTNKYDGNRFSVSGTSTKSLSSGDVMFLSGDASTNTMAAVTGIALPESEFDWDACAKSGVVKVKNGAKVAGYFQVYDIVKNEGRNVILKVSLLQLGTDPSIDYESGAPCYFHGVFFA